MISREMLSSLAQEANLMVTGVSTADPFEWLRPVLSDRINSGMLEGFDWFTQERAAFSTNPRNLHNSAESIISAGIPYWQPDIQKPEDGVLRGKISRYAWGRDYHKTMKQRLKHLHTLLEAETGRTIESRELVDTARIVDRAAAARSGLGWYGKNTMILVPRHGSWVMLGELVVDIEIEPDPPLKPKCGRCTRCLDVCPTGALVSEYTLEAPKCISFLTIELRESIPHNLRPQMENWVFGCDMCQEICPYTNAAKPVDEPSFKPLDATWPWPSLHWLLSVSEDEFLERYRGTAVMRAKRRGMARNAAVAIGNTGTENDTDGLLHTMVNHDEPMARSHAAWAALRISGQAALPEVEHHILVETDSQAREDMIVTINNPPEPRF